MKIIFASVTGILFTKKVYLDNAATTRVRKEVIPVVIRYLKRRYGNPSSAHRTGLIAMGSLEMARERIANILNCSSNEIIFTGSGSEGNNMAIKGVLKSAGKGRKIITSQIEHSSILNTCKSLEKEGVSVKYLKVDEKGRYDLRHLQELLTDDTTLVSLSYVNNEIGTVQDIDTIGSIVKNKNVLLHLDAVQALPYFNMDMSKVNADLVTFSGHKLYAPKGIGLLYIREGTPLEALISGGEQESGFRSGTQNVASIVGLSKAIVLNHTEKKQYVSSLTAMRNQIIESVLNGIPDSILTGDSFNRAPNSASFCFKNINGKRLVKELSWAGIETSSGSACSSAKDDPSHVLSACNISNDYILGSLRVTLGRYNTQSDVNYFLKVLPVIISKMRNSKYSQTGNKAFISQEDFKNKLKKKEPIQILDVRLFNYPKFWIKDSIPIPFWKLKNNLYKLNPDSETVVICHHGDVLAPETQQMLIKKGFTDVKVLKGGMAGYLQNISHLR